MKRKLIVISAAIIVLFLRAVAGACLAPEASLPLPRDLPYKSDWLCRIGTEEADYA